jgi:hypothetical protein
MSVTVEDLRSEIKEYNLKVLADGDSAVIQRSIEKAVIWAKAKVTAASGIFDEDTEINRLIVVKRALYELYSYAENESVANDKKEDAMELLRAAYGDSVDAAGYQSNSEKSPIPAGVVKPGAGRTNTEWP